MPGVTEGNSNKQRDADICGFDQSRSRAHADRDTPSAIGIKSRAVLEGEEFASATIRVQAIKEAVLGSAFMGKRILGSNEWECDR